MPPDFATPATPGAQLPPMFIGTSPVYFSGEDGLRLVAINSAAGVTLRLSGRFLRVGSSRVEVFRQDNIPATDRTPTSFTLPMAEGWLLDAAVVVAGGTPLEGQTWARIAIVRGGPPAGLNVSQLGYGYVTVDRTVSWPLASQQGSLEGAGALRSVSGTTPAAGAEIAETVPTGARWELLALFAQFVTSAAVANRFPTLTIDDGTNLLYRMGSGAAQTASLTHRRQWFQAPVATSIDNANNIAVPIPNGLYLGAGYRIRTVTTLIDAADQWSLVQLLVREWLEA